ncbi:RNA polymerase factor sigma-54 [Alkalibaculum sp. M08DMB]|uniref:RNA polymerase factor sigma-54 n=1 Tax=Alkalibaculum sporogenes TaxID=2655001 RepID=A0A6A7KBA5_9FIRM|nr:RNA polymerase factor sigma-54 [Alkalibaculum sporogenes]MPW26676.1 RNA polymerase factor sigma-54 [Alkalibaculum sporogenes]
MDLNMSQGLVQQQKLILTAQMQNSLNILQMSIIDLQKDIAKQLEENPLLEYNTDVQDTPDVSSWTKEIIDARKAIDQEKFQLQNSSYTSDNTMDPLNLIIQKQTLKEYLKDQLVDLVETPEILNICNYIIENIDSRGYLSCTIEDIIKDLNISSSKIIYALQLVQQFEPNGVAARDLKECLKLQLIKNGIDDENLYYIVDSKLEAIANNQIKQIANLLNISSGQAQDYFDYIKTLEPKPSRGFYTGDVENYIIPEAYIRKVQNELLIIKNDKVLPRLTINRLYKDILKDETDTEVIDFIKSKLYSAENFIKGIEQRDSTITKILKIIVEKQEDYFYYGPRYLKPMVISSIADCLNLNESTISRAIKDKYISTPHATVKIKDLFTGGFKLSCDDSITSSSVKNQIKNIIDNEDKSQPISDEMISQTLKEKGIKIARRTVAKYREELDILSSSKRKVFK